MADISALRDPRPDTPVAIRELAVHLLSAPNPQVMPGTRALSRGLASGHASSVVDQSGGAPLGTWAAFLVILACEAGVPVPVPVDLAMIALGVAVGNGSLNVWVAAGGVEVVAVLGTTTLLSALRGPGGATVARFGPRVGLSPVRLGRIRERVTRRGLPALVIGRAVPGLRTVTVLAAATAGVPARRSLPALVLGSTLFLQAHLLIGLSVAAPVAAALGSPAGRLALVAVVVTLAAVAVLLRRRRRTAPVAWRDGTCPACLALAVLTNQDDDESPGWR